MADQSLGAPLRERPVYGGRILAGVVSEWELPVSPEQFLRVFREWPIGPYPGAAELLTEVRESVPIGCLSNINTTHWEDQVARWPILDLFDYRFLSFDLGLVKPDAAVFERVAELLPVERDRVLFLDDNTLNAEAARSAGFGSEQVRGPAEAAGTGGGRGARDRSALGW